MDEPLNKTFNQGVTHALNAHQFRVSGELEKANASDAATIEAFDAVLVEQPDHAGALGGKG
jgi:hypothetical protein